MRKKYIFGKKLYISILTTIVVLLTTVATTFAWVGVFANSTFDTFNIGIKNLSLEEYGVEISLTGEDGTFSDVIQSEDIKRVILKNWGYSDVQIETYGVEGLFYNLNLDQCTTLPIVQDNKIVSFGSFTDIEGNPTHNYYTFDIYVAAIHSIKNEIASSSDFKLDVYLAKDIMTGTQKERVIINPFIYPDGFVNPLSGTNLKDGFTPILASTTINKAKVDSKSAYRVGFEKYKVVDKGHPEQYSNENPLSSIIYSGDNYNYPTYNENSSTYEFGGILEDDLNMAIGYYNSYEYKYAATRLKSVSATESNADIFAGDIYTIRGVEGTNPDKIFNSSTNHLIDSTNVSEQIDIEHMMKIKISFWIEGWDADCFNILNKAPVSLKIGFQLKNEDEF